MAGTPVDRLRTAAVMAAVAVVASALIVLAPLVAGAVRAERAHTDLTVVNLRAYPRINDNLLQKELKKADAKTGVLIIIPPAQPIAEPSLFDCSNQTLPKSCPLVHAFSRRVVVADAEDDAETLNDLYGPGAADDEDATYVRSGRQELSTAFAWSAALKVGLLMTIVAAASLLFAVRYRPRRVPTSPAVAGFVPAQSAASPYLSQAAASPAPDMPASPPARPRPDGRSAARPAPTPAAMPAPKPAAPPQPLPPDAVPPPGTRVVARTHFGPHGGYVDAGGVVLWASLREPGDRAYPGQPLTVVGPERGQDFLVVSHRVTEEVLP